MDLTAKDAARLLNVDENTLQDWIASGTIPSHRIGDKTRLSRVELLEWAATRKLSLAPAMFRTSTSNPAAFVLSDAVVRGGVLHELDCTDKRTALGAVCQVIPLPAGVDRDELYSVLVAREALCSTGIGNGFAIPHPRGPIVLGVSEPQVTVAFPKRAIEFGSLDGVPVHTMFVIVSTTVRGHLLLLSHLMFALKRDSFTKLLSTRADQAAIVAELRRIEGEIPGESGRP
jgi:PTS system nitrogen regulatory IIA component